MAGFTSQKDLRVVLYPNALRFFWAGLHEPLRAAGAWPSARQVLQSGFVLEPDVRNSLAAKLGALVAPRDATWPHVIRSVMRVRHWPASEEVSASGARGNVNSLLDLPRVERLQVLAEALEDLCDARPDAELLQISPEHYSDVGEGNETAPQMILLRSMVRYVECTRQSSPPDVLHDDLHCDCPSVWAYDLDSITLIQQPDKDGWAQYGFTRILEVAPVSSHALQEGVTRYSASSSIPAWGCALMASAADVYDWDADDWDQLRTHYRPSKTMGVLKKWIELTNKRSLCRNRHECRCWQLLAVQLAPVAWRRRLCGH